MRKQLSSWNIQTTRVSTQYKCNSQLPQAGLKTHHILRSWQMLYQLSYRDSSAGWVETHIHVQSNTTQGKVNLNLANRSQGNYHQTSTTVFKCVHVTNTQKTLPTLGKCLSLSACVSVCKSVWVLFWITEVCVLESCRHWGCIWCVLANIAEEGRPETVAGIAEVAVVA